MRAILEETGMQAGGLSSILNVGRHHPIGWAPERTKKERKEFPPVFTGTGTLSSSYPWTPEFQASQPWDSKAYAGSPTGFFDLWHQMENYIDFPSFEIFRLGLSHATGISGSPADRWPIVELLSLHNCLNQFS